MSTLNSYQTKEGILLDSNQAIDNVGIANSLTYNIGNPKTKIRRLQLGNFSTCNVFYNITSANNTLIIDEGSPTDITVPVGTYDVVSFSAALQTALNSAGLGGVFTVSISNVNLRLTITSTAPYTLSFPNTSVGIWLNMGFGRVRPAAQGPQSTLTSPYPVQLINVNKIGIQLLNINVAPIITSTSNGPCCHFIVDNNVPFGSQLIYIPQTETDNTIDSQFSNSFILSKNLKVLIYDLQTGQLLDNITHYQLLLNILC